MCLKNPNTLNDFQINYCCDYYEYKNRNVSQNAKALIKTFRMIAPHKLHKKYRGNLKKNGKPEDE